MSDFYVFRVKKASGGYRIIQAPKESKMQRLLELKAKIEENPDFNTKDMASKGGGILKNALIHADSKYILNLDIYKCFQRTTFDMVRKVNTGLSTEELKECFYKDILPTGAPTSNLLLNAVLHNFDGKVSYLCSQIGLKYSRYVDDITVSGINKEHILYMKQIIEVELKEIGYVLKRQKTRLQSPGGRKSVTGLNVLNGKVSVGRKYIKRTKLLHKINIKYGLVSEPTLKGRLSYIKQIQPELKII